MPTPPPVKTSTPDAAKDGEQHSQTGAAHPYRVAGRKGMQVRQGGSEQQRAAGCLPGRPFHHNWSALQSIAAKPRSRLGLTLLDCLADGEAAGTPNSSGALVVHQPGSQWRQQLRQSMAADLEQLQVIAGCQTPCTGLEPGAGRSHWKAAALGAVHARSFQQEVG